MKQILHISESIFIALTSEPSNRSSYIAFGEFGIIFGYHSQIFTSRGNLFVADLLLLHSTIVYFIPHYFFYRRPITFITLARPLEQ